MTARTVWRWLLAASLGPVAAVAFGAAPGCAIVGGIQEPAPEHCSNDKTDGDETGLNCGGSCGLCPTAACVTDADCASGICYKSKCALPTTPDACPMGGTEHCQVCHNCGPNMACVADLDCTSGLCLEHLCVACDHTGNTCAAGDGACVGSRCLDVTCGNLIHDPGEDDIDCGGVCTATLGGHLCKVKPCAADECGARCPTLCGEGAPCASDADCVVKHCDLAGGGVATCQVQDHCLDGLQNNGETAVDCGGPECVGCGATKHCVVAADCVTGICNAGVCSTPGHCGDTMKGDGETDVDCGAECPPCADALACEAGADCVSGLCVDNVCVEACNDTIKDREETDVDCGGPTCPQCVDGQACKGASDCAGGFCVGGACASACNNGVQDSGETDVDCGGHACKKCVLGKTCMIPEDCETNACSGGHCVPPSCTDGVQNGMETGIDCGGSSPCGLCDGDPCSQAMPGACQSGYCSPGNVCASSCSDGTQNGSETDVDCGGACTPCILFQRCMMGADCAPDQCTNGICRAGTCGPTECASFDMVCGFCSGDVCGKDSDCQSGKCKTAPVPHICM
jgi:hypothetical protein